MLFVAPRTLLLAEKRLALTVNEGRHAHEHYTAPTQHQAELAPIWDAAGKLLRQPCRASQKPKRG